MRLSDARVMLVPAAAFWPELRPESAAAGGLLLERTHCCHVCRLEVFKIVHSVVDPRTLSRKGGSPFAQIPVQSSQLQLHLGNIADRLQLSTCALSVACAAIA